MKAMTTGGTSRYRAFVTAACAAFALAAQAGEPLVFQLHWVKTSGVRDIEAGRYEQGVQRLEARLAESTAWPANRAPAFIALCTGYAMLNRLDDAANACDAAIRTERDTDLAYSNRGIVNMMRGRHKAALQDFDAALHRNAPNKVTRENKRLAMERIVAIDWQRKRAAVAGNMDIQDVSTVTLHRSGQ